VYYRLGDARVPVHSFRLTDGQAAWLRERAAERGATVSDVFRSVLEDAIAGDAAARGRAAVEAALDRVLRKHVDRLAALVAKGAMGAHTSKYLVLALLTNGGRTSGKELLEQAAAAAASDLRVREAPKAEPQGAEAP